MTPPNRHHDTTPEGQQGTPSPSDTTSVILAYWKGILLVGETEAILEWD